MLFLIYMEVSVPPNTPAELIEQMRQAEHARAFELIEAGKVRRAWRPVGTADTCGIWEADVTDIWRRHPGVSSQNDLASLTCVWLVARGRAVMQNLLAIGTKRTPSKPRQ